MGAESRPEGIDLQQCVVFALDDRLFGVGLSAVLRVLRAVAITPLAQAPDIVLGIINLGGRIVPVVNLRRRLHLPERDLQLTDQLLVARTRSSGDSAREGRLLALAVDRVEGVHNIAAQKLVAAEAILPGLQPLEGVAKTDHGLILIHSLRDLLSLEENKAVEELVGKAEQ